MSEIKEVPEGIFSGTERVFSVSKIEIQDMLSEGEIDGLVTREDVYDGEVGDVGWSKVTEGNSFSFLRSIYWNEVPVMDSSNNLNFQQVEATEGKGKPNGEVNTKDKLKDETSITRNISERLRGPTYINGALAAPQDEFAKFYRILNKDCFRAEVNIKVNSLSATSREPSEEGDIIDAEVKVFIQYRPLYSSVNKTAAFIDHGNVTIRGKTTSPFIQKAILDMRHMQSDGLGEDFIGWEIKIFRTTREPETLDIRNTTFIDTITEHYDSKFSYPNTAIVSQKFSAEYFSSIPQRAFDTRGIKVKIPSNYDPVKRTYKDYWDGTWSTDKSGPYGNAGLYWTDNPAWCFYDLLTNKRYGLGKYINQNSIDKWGLYEISKYCDTLVSDGMGGVEPRFTCNLYIQTREDAFKIVNDMASIFRGITYYAGGNIFSVQDSEKKPLYTFTNANVKEGDFNYSNSSKKVRHTVAIIRYNDKTNFYKPALEYVEDVDGIRKHGIREIEMTAFGCTSRGQAIRLGRWALFTENMETESISFTAGLEGAYIKPGDVFSVHDSHRTTNRWAGRCKNIDIFPITATHVDGYSRIVLDQDIQPQLVEGREYKFTLLTPTYNYDPTQVTDVDSRDSSDIRKVQTQSFIFTGSRSNTNSIAKMDTVAYNTGQYPELSGYSRVQLYSGFQSTDHIIDKNAIWTIEPTKAIYTAEELEDGLLPENKYRCVRVEEVDGVEFNIAGIEYSEQKYSAIESGLSFDNTTVEVVPNPPGSISAKLKKVTEYTSLINYEVGKPTPNSDGLSSYFVYAKKGNNWVKGDYVGNYPEFLNQNLNEIVTNSSLVPDAKWRIGVHPHNTNWPQQYLPTEAGRYIFKAFSANIAGTHSDGSKSTSVDVPTVNPLLDVTIKNLREVDDTANATNAAGGDEGRVYDHTKTDNDFRWTSEVANSQVNLNDYSYRITIRNPSNFSHIYAWYTGYQPNQNLYSSRSSDSVSYKFPFTGNAAMAVGAQRKYKIVIEAHDEKGNSSAGGTFSPTQDSTFTNKNGYDVAVVNNPNITDPRLQNLTNNAGHNIVCEGSLTLDKEIKLLFRRNTYSDSAGAFLYISKNNFTTNDVKGKKLSQIRSDIEVAEIKPYSSSIVYTPIDYDIRNSDELYVAYSLYDSWDATRESNDVAYNLISNQAVSNVEKLKKGTQIIDTVGDGFKIWLRIGIDGSWIGQGIDRVEQIPNDATSHRGVALPASYINYNGYQSFACYFQGTNIVYIDAALNNWQGGYANTEFYSTYFHHPARQPCTRPLNADGSCPDDGLTLVDWFPNYYCGYIDPEGNTPDWWRRGGKTSDRNHPSDANSRTSVTSSLQEGYRRFRVYLDTKTKPQSKNYAVIGMNINNLEYVHPNDVPEFGGYHVAETHSISAQATPYMKNNSTHAYYGDSPSLWKHHPAGFGQGFANLVREKEYFDIHMGHMIDMSYLREGFFGIITKDEDKALGGPKAGKIIS